MKNLKHKKGQIFEVNVKLDGEENRIVRILKEKYAINISALFKVLIKKHFEELQKLYKE